MVRPSVPATAREMAAVGVLARLACIIACSKPGRRRSKIGSSASGVVSRGASPVPPLVRMRSYPWPSASSMTRERSV